MRIIFAYNSPSVGMDEVLYGIASTKINKSSMCLPTFPASSYFFLLNCTEPTTRSYTINILFHSCIYHVGQASSLNSSHLYLIWFALIFFVLYCHFCILFNILHVIIRYDKIQIFNPWSSRKRVNIFIAGGKGTRHADTITWVTEKWTHCEKKGKKVVTASLF